MHTQTLNRKIKDAYLLSESFSIKSKEVILHGSDKHLDQISETTKLFNELIDALSNLNDLIEENFPSKRDAANDLKFGLHSLHSSLLSFIKTVKNDKIANSSYNDCIARLEVECDQVVEYINDLNDYVISQEDLIADDFFNDL